MQLFGWTLTRSLSGIPLIPRASSLSGSFYPCVSEVHEATNYVGWYEKLISRLVEKQMNNFKKFKLQTCQQTDNKMKNMISLQAITRSTEQRNKIDLKFGLFNKDCLSTNGNKSKLTLNRVPYNRALCGSHMNHTAVWRAHCWWQMWHHPCCDQGRQWISMVTLTQ